MGSGDLVGLQPPFFSSDRGDIDVHDSVQAMASSVEVYDLEGSEFFDSQGRRLVATADGYAVQLAVGDGAAEPQRLDLLLRSYFRMLEQTRPSFSERAKSAQDLAELVALRTELDRLPRRRCWQAPG
ncbi:MAG: hypothetical protein QOJ11_3976 [Frankiales bacterium]|nr:hypothetical protein [Frankiales bacterium]